MPIFDHECLDCGHVFEAIVKLDEEPKECPKCDGHKFRRLVSAASFRLKGSGWYETDFKHNGIPPAAKKDIQNG